MQICYPSKYPPRTNTWTVSTHISPRHQYNPRNFIQDKELISTTFNPHPPIPSTANHSTLRGKTSSTRRKTSFPSLTPREPPPEHTATAEYLKYVEYLTKYTEHRNKCITIIRNALQDVRDGMRMRANKREQDYATRNLQNTPYGQPNNTENKVLTLRDVKREQINLPPPANQRTHIQVTKQTETHTPTKHNAPHTFPPPQDTKQTHKIKHLTTSGPRTHSKPACIHLGPKYTTPFTKIKPTQMMKLEKPLGQSQRRLDDKKFNTIHTLLNKPHQTLRFVHGLFGSPDRSYSLF